MFMFLAEYYSRCKYVSQVNYESTGLLSWSKVCWLQGQAKTAYVCMIIVSTSQLQQENICERVGESVNGTAGTSQSCINRANLQTIAEEIIGFSEYYQWTYMLSSYRKLRQWGLTTIKYKSTTRRTKSIRITTEVVNTSDISDVTKHTEQMTLITQHLTSLDYIELVL